MSDEKEPKPRFTLPEGRVINAHLFELDEFKGQRAYRLEMAWPKDTPGLLGSDSFEDDLYDAAKAEWGEEVANDMFDNHFGLIVPFKDGDEMAEEREAAGKPGDAYKGMWVLRTKTIFNKDGQEYGPGGIQVWDEDVNPVQPVDRGKIYNGCMGCIAVSINPWHDDDAKQYDMPGERLSTYLVAFQKTGDGERLASAEDTSKMFKPVGRKAKSDGGGRRGRKG